jgi:tetratricopeptide (TPR) repeat protein
MTPQRELLSPTGRRELLVTLALTGIAVLAFVVVLALVTRFRTWQSHLADRLYRQGEQALQASVPAKAIDDFRSALSFDQENDAYQFNLARALEADHRTDEAHSYLLDLWDRKPQDGAVNLELGRLAAQNHSTNRAIRYYHNAIYGLWDTAPEANRHQARMELIKYLLSQNDRTQAESEIIAMQAGLSADPQLHAQVAVLFATIQDYDRALDQYRRALQLNPKNASALAGAGETAFQLGHFGTAARYLQAAANQNALDEHSRQLLQTASDVLDSNPFQRRLSSRERRQRLRTAFDVASKKLLVCIQPQALSPMAAPSTSGSQARNSSRSSADLQALAARQKDLQNKMRSSAFLNDPDSMDEVMDFISSVGQAIPQNCGPPLDKALLLIAQYRSGAER